MSAPIFADGTYEGDLAALAGVTYRMGREACSEFNEPHAGILFMKPESNPPDEKAGRVGVLHDTLKLRQFKGWQVPLPQSTGAADDAVQACNYRTTLTTEPANRIPIPAPKHYAPYLFRSLEIFAGIEGVPNFLNDVDVQAKEGWNRAAQYLGTCGFFSDYDAGPADSLDPAIAKAWVAAFRSILDGTHQPKPTANAVMQAEGQPGAPVTVADFREFMPEAAPGKADAKSTVTRAQAMEWIWNAVPASWPDAKANETQRSHANG